MEALGSFLCPWAGSLLMPAAPLVRNFSFVTQVGVRAILTMMAQERITPGVSERRCPNCGTRVARTAESCFMCGYDLRNQPQKRRRLSLVDALLVLAVLAVLIFWWRVGTESSREVGEDGGVQAILPTSVPLMERDAHCTADRHPPARTVADPSAYHDRDCPCKAYRRRRRDAAVDRHPVRRDGRCHPAGQWADRTS